MDSGERNIQILSGIRRKVIETSQQLTKFGNMEDPEIMNLDDELYNVELATARVIGEEEASIHNRKIHPKPS